MALVLKDRVRVTSTTTGTGALTLGAAVQGYQDFTAIGDGNTTFYTIADVTTGAWETGVGTYSSTGPTLTRTQVLESSNAGALVSFGAGAKDVFVSYPASRAVSGAQGLVENDADITKNYTLTTGRNAMSAGPITVAAGVVVTVPSGSRWVIL